VNSSTATLGTPSDRATRYEKRAANYRAMVVIAALMIWLSS
jgi:hypothetical protein